MRSSVKRVANDALFTHFVRKSREKGVGDLRYYFLSYRVLTRIRRARQNGRRRTVFRVNKNKRVGVKTGPGKTRTWCARARVVVDAYYSRTRL